MDQWIKSINQDIRKGKLPEENIPCILNYMADQYHTYGLIELAMNYYSFYEAFCDEEDTWSKESRGLIFRLNTIIQKNLVGHQGGYDLKNAVKDLDKLRNEIMKRMDLLTSYTDIFQIYEYVLNRMEYRFKEEFISLDEEEFSKEVLRYIFDSQDNFIINEKIREIVGQLPIRMTKQKYFDILRDSIMAYQGSDESSLESFLYMLRTSAMLCPMEDLKEYYPVLWEKKQYFAELKFKEMTQEEFEQAENALKLSTLILESETTVYIRLQEIVNEVYTILLCSTYTGIIDQKTQNLEDTAVLVIKAINDVFVNNEKSDLPMELMERFTDFEGIQEEISYDLVVLEESLYEVDKNHKSLVESLVLSSLLNALLRSKDLLSSSLFINLDEKENNETVDEEKAEEEAEKLLKDLAVLFTDADKAVSRAVMANTLNKVPVFFQNHTEVMEYIRYSMEHCANSYEKAACFEIINEIMSE